MELNAKLLNWYSENQRDLPWRQTQDPYPIWLSEVILQQTRVVQGLPYYEKFLAAFPTIFDLAEAEEDYVLKLWQGLGYYNRARNMLKTAQQVVERGGKFPKNYLGLLELKGIGPYTAAAIASFAYNEAVPVVDGNVYRVLSRVLGIDDPIDTTTGKKRFAEASELLLDRSEPGTYNQAIMEFGALHCTPKNPSCLTCPMQIDCVALETNRVGELPIKKSKTKQKSLYLNYVILRKGSELLVHRRPETGFWAGLYDFRLSQSENRISQKTFAEDILPELIGNLNKVKVHNISPDYTHVLSHRKLHIRFWEIEVHEFPDLEERERIVSIEELKNLAVPRIVDKHLLTGLFSDND
ncbi:A/G-specific adenine glycosylase [bacterium SCSIO 12741]|nr:A/G-specific adenine glycosylase [bacterium SCSIO 12741]